MNYGNNACTFHILKICIRNLICFPDIEKFIYSKTSFKQSSIYYNK